MTRRHSQRRKPVQPPLPSSIGAPNRDHGGGEQQEQEKNEPIQVVLMHPGGNRNPHTRQQRAFSAALLAEDLQIDSALAEEVLTELGKHNLLMMSQLDTPNGPLNTYQLRPGCNLIPFLYFGAELMRSLGHYSLIFPARRTALMRGALGENSLSPHWITTAHQEENQLPYGKYGMD